MSPNPPATGRLPPRPPSPQTANKTLSTPKKLFPTNLNLNGSMQSSKKQKSALDTYNPDLSTLPRLKTFKLPTISSTNVQNGDPPTSATPPRPPVPPQSQSRVRKQNKSISNTENPNATVSRSTGNRSDNSCSRNSAKPNYDSDDGLLLNSRSVGAGDVKRPAPVEISLKIPINKIDMTSIASSNSHSYHRLKSRSPSPSFSLRSSNNSSLASGRISSFASTSRSLAANYSALQSTPRRIFPQTYTRGDPLDINEMRTLESSPVVFDANLSFVLGCKKQPVRQSFRPSPSHMEQQTSSAYLSEKIQNFLRRTDHVNEEWKALSRRSRRHGSVGGSSSGRATPTSSVYNSRYDDFDTISLIERQRERSSERGSSCSSLGRSRSTQNILIKGYQLSKTLPRTPTSRSNSVVRDFSEADDDDDRTIHEEDDNVLDEVRCWHI